MNEKSKFNELVNDLDKLDRVDLSRAVMHKINAMQMNRVIPKKRQKAVVFVASIIFFITTISAGAVYAFPNHWNGILISLTQKSPEKKNPIDSIERMEQWLQQPGTVKEQYPLDVDNNDLGFKFLTNRATIIPLEDRIAGQINLNIPESKIQTGRLTSTVEIKYTPSIIDFYRQQDQWVIAIQSENSDASKAAQGSLVLSNDYIGNWEVIKNTDHVLAIYSDGGYEKTINLSVLNSDKTVIELQIIGNVSKESLVGIMEGYISQ
ncbi:hypothetical protein [Paenibacillus sp. GCM10028914]|uniref:hypothetical protein n=1 Tax=Paenibacillus sp. GCM10028914 TaxID=3273416 RepID=UPI003612FC78